ncbi:MAG: hypothetical protein H6972_04745 [Gammaproteobacteria bacterium]|nr:hypothetical protein [Gammaproteobacteria bacterium]
MAHIEQGLLAVPDQPDLLAREQVRRKSRTGEWQQGGSAIKRQQRRRAAAGGGGERQSEQAGTGGRCASKRRARRQRANAAGEQARQQEQLNAAGGDQYWREQSCAQGDECSIERWHWPDHKATRLRREVSAEIAAQQRQQVEREQREQEIAVVGTSGRACTGMAVNDASGKQCARPISKC